MKVKTKLVQPNGREGAVGKTRRLDERLLEHEDSLHSSEKCFFKELVMTYKLDLISFLF